MSGGGAFGANRVGGIIPAKGEIELNAGRPVTKLKVRNTGDRPVQIGSHFHFFEVNRYWVTVAALKSLADEGTISNEVVAQAIAKYELDVNKPNPMTV